MDKLKGMAEKAMKGGSSGSSGGATGGQGSAGQEDYVDKGVDAAEKKFNIHSSREQNEKYTDMARDQYEKHTGNKVDSKYSN